MPLYVRLMDYIYKLCILIAIVSMVTTTTLVFVGAMARYFLGMGAMYSEQVSIMLAIQLAFYGGAACYRAHAHLALTLFVSYLPKLGQLIMRYFVILAFMMVSGGMVWWGIDLVRDTVGQHYAEFPYEWLKVGYIYSAVPITGGITFLFALEQLFYRQTDSFHGGDDAGPETEMDIIRKAQGGEV